MEMYQLVTCFRSAGFSVRQLPSGYDQAPESLHREAMNKAAVNAFNYACAVPDTVTAVLYDPNGEMVNAYANPKDFTTAE
jgi:hypothetical protein